MGKSNVGCEAQGSGEDSEKMTYTHNMIQGNDKVEKMLDGIGDHDKQLYNGKIIVQGKKLLDENRKKKLKVYIASTKECVRT